MHLSTRAPEYEKVSIIVPVFNAERYIRRCIDSILMQSHKNIEIIAIDDGSIDNSGTILDEYSKSYSCVKAIHTKNHGVGEARNIGIENASGEFISFVDSDDFVHPNYISRLLQVLIETETDVSVLRAIDLPVGDLNGLKDKWIVDITNPVIMAVEPDTDDTLFDYTQPSAHRVVWGGAVQKKHFARIAICN